MVGRTISMIWLSENTENTVFLDPPVPGHPISIRSMSENTENTIFSDVFWRVQLSENESASPHLPVQ